MYEDFESSVKNNNNRRIALWARRYLKREPHYALVLDGPETRTSNALIGAGVSLPDIIYAPQYSSYDASLMRKKKTCVVIDGSLSNAIRSQSRTKISRLLARKISIFNLDFTSSIYGKMKTKYEEECYPLQDFYDCLGATSQDEVIISLTVSDRIGCMTVDEKYYDGRTCFNEQIHLDFLTPIAQYHGYRIMRKDYRSYRRTPRGTTMRFFIYHLRRYKRNAPESIDFAIYNGRHVFHHPKGLKDMRLLRGFNPDFEGSWVCKDELNQPDTTAMRIHRPPQKCQEKSSRILRSASRNPESQCAFIDHRENAKRNLLGS